VSFFITSSDSIHALTIDQCPQRPQGKIDGNGMCVPVDPNETRSSRIQATGECCTEPGGCYDCQGVTCNLTTNPCPDNYKCGENGCFYTGSNDAGVTVANIEAASDYWKMQALIPYQEKVFLAPENDMSLESTGNAMGTNVMNMLTTNGIGVTKPIAEQMVAMGKPVPQGAAQYLAGGIASMTSSQPVSTTTYLADLGRQAGIYNPVYAQGTGFSALDPVLKIWKAFRNMAYLAFVVIFVVIGFMIMFRSKVSQQAVISIQLALPQIIVTLLLITFSYAIASLMIDLIYFLIYLIVEMFKTFGVLTQESDAANILMTKNIFGIARNTHAAGLGAEAVADTIKDIIEGVGGVILGKISQPFAALIFAIAILISLFKLFFQLLLSYIGIIVSTIFAPILLLFNAMPGSQSFQKWLKGIFANILVFPVTALMLIISAALVGDNSDPKYSWGVADGIGYSGNNPDFAKVALPIVAGGISANTIQAIIALGFLMMMPKVVELTQKALGVEGGIGGMLGAIAEPLKQGFAGAAFAPKQIGGGIITGRQQHSDYARQARREAILRNPGASDAQINTMTQAAIDAGPSRRELITNAILGRKRG